MCLAPNVDPGASAAPNDAIPAATSLALGSVPRGSAGLGRLQLKLGDKPASVAPKPSTQAAAPTDPTTAPAAPGQAPATEGVVASTVKRVPNSSLRLSETA